MWIVLTLKILAGALAGAVVGFFAGQARTCSTKGCDAIPHSLAVRVFYVLAMAVLGAGAAWYWIHR
jgi:hypothetical protein